MSMLSQAKARQDATAIRLNSTPVKRKSSDRKEVLSGTALIFKTNVEATYIALSSEARPFHCGYNHATLKLIT